MDLGEKWEASSVEVIDSDKYESESLRLYLRKTLRGRGNSPRRDAVVVSYWWD